jgi:hypothetical protein
MILVDSESSHTFMSSKLAAQLSRCAELDS